MKLCHVVYEVWLVSYLFPSFQTWYFRKWIITSIGQSKHMWVTRFNPLWVSVYTKTVDSVFRALWLATQSVNILHYRFTDSPPVPHVRCEQHAFSVCCCNKQRNFTTNQASCSRNTRRKWRSSVWKFYQVDLCLFDSNVSIRPVKKFFVCKYKLSFSLALLYLVDLFINKLKTKFNNLFLQNDFKYKKNSQLLLKKFPRKS